MYCTFGDRGSGRLTDIRRVVLPYPLRSVNAFPPHRDVITIERRFYRSQQRSSRRPDLSRADGLLAEENAAQHEIYRVQRPENSDE
jgi:hypothetical protein